MLKLQTPVVDLKCKVGISFEDKIMMLGSCFSDNIGRQLADLGFDVCVNPFGTLYNPISILQSVELLVSDRLFGPSDCVQIGAGDERWCSFYHHTSFARATQEEFLAHANEALSAARRFFATCNKVILTFGTAWCFRNIATGTVVSNCLKRPASEFDRARLSASEVTSALSRHAGLCNHRSSDRHPKQFIFTVSPIRHFKDGAHGNQLSKAALLLGINEVMGQRCDYFPSYEIMMDELRDYRFYAEDMCHPTQQTAEYICERFLDWALPADEHETLKENIRAFRHGCHIVK